MTLDAESIDPPIEDAVSNVLKWVLLGVAILTFGLLAWATTVTYRTAPPQPERFVDANGTVHGLWPGAAADRGADRLAARRGPRLGPPRLDRLVRKPHGESAQPLQSGVILRPIRRGLRM
jgi:hypothetical protein